jgi:hypothetical protein
MAQTIRVPVRALTVDPQPVTSTTVRPDEQREAQITIPVEGLTLTGGMEPTPARTEDFMDPQPGSFSFREMAGSVWSQINPMPLLAQIAETSEAEMASADAKAKAGDYRGALEHIWRGQPVNMIAGGLAQGHWEQIKKGWRLMRDGRESEGVGHLLFGLTPVVGPALAHGAEQIGTGEVDQGVGTIVGTALPFGTKYLPRTAGLAPFANTNPAESAAVAFGRSRGIPIDPATATGSPMVARAQQIVGDTLGGFRRAEQFQEGQRTALARTGRELAAEANQQGPAVDAVRAGEQVRTGLGTNVAQAGREANAAYGRLRAIEDAAPKQRVQIGTKLDEQGNPVAVEALVSLPVDLRPLKSATQDMYRQLVRSNAVAPLQGGKAEALRALDRVQNGPDHVSLTTADAALSDLKAVARSTTPDARTPGQAIAATVVKDFHRIVDDVAKRAGPDAVAALNEGRAATKVKTGADKVRRLLFGKDPEAAEPGAVYRRLVARDDTAVNRLRMIARETPNEVRGIARAFLDDLIDTATAEGGFARADKLWADWQRLGPETRKLLFTPEHAAALDKYFLLAKRIGQNPNPSGSARSLTLINVGASLPANIVSRLLYTPQGANLLARGVQLPVQNPTAVATFTGQMNALVARGTALAAGDSDADVTTQAGTPAGRQ